jgi:hypothetical protein
LDNPETGGLCRAQRIRAKPHKQTRLHFVGPSLV